MFSDKLAMNEAQTRVQMAAVVKSIETEVKSLTDIIRLSLPYMDQQKQDYSGQPPLDRIEMIAKLAPPSAKNGRKEWQVISSFFQDGSKTKPWAPQYIFLSLKTIKEESLDGKKTIALSLLDPKRKPHILLLSPSGVAGEYFAGLVGAEVFQGLMDRMKGQASSVFVVNQQGQALGHTVPEYVGSLLGEDPLVANLMASADSSRFGTFKNLRNETVQGLYEQVGSTNIYAVITTPVKALLAEREPLRIQFVMLGLGLALVGLGIFVFTYKPEREPMRGAGPASAGSQAVLPAALAAPLNKMEAYTKVASSLAHEMRGPLTSILGHVQLLKNKGDSERAADHLERIEREARSAREIVTKLQAFAGEGISKTTHTNLESVVLRALKSVEGKIVNKGIKLQKNISSQIAMDVSTDLVAKAIENILQNSIEAMERVPQKTLDVNLRDDNGSVILEIKDTGEGISNHEISRIFDPFFTTKAASNHIGLGLATSFGIFKEFHGEVSAVSEKSKGTTIKVVFSPDGEAAASKIAFPQAKPFSEAVEALKTAEKDKTVRIEAEELSSASKHPQTSKSVVASEAKAAPPMNPLLVDNAIDKMIDGEEDEVPNFPPPPAPEFEEPPPPVKAAQAPAKDFSAKIDKPKIDLKKKSANFEEVNISIRRPGEKA